MSADLLAQLETTLGASYTIERELGGGGMSRVFLAVETSLGRRVVLKLLSPDLAAGVSAQRFSREVRLAASLQQANIVPVLSTGETNGLPYYTMPFVDGLSLHERLTREKQLTLSTAVGILRDVARALAYAHEHGVVHRDIKPQNVLLSGDAAVVTDFGIAKAISAARDGEGNAPSGSTTVTLAGTALGTPAYMAPEQIAADPGVDHRADLYSFGCLAYEVIAGTAPFEGYTTQQLLAAHLGERPVPLGERRPDCPPAIVGLVMQCLEKEPQARPASARELLIELEGTPSQATTLERLRNRFSRRHRHGTAIFGAVVLATAIVVTAPRWLPGNDASTRVETVAVIPFANVGGDTAQEYLAEGIANELTTALGKIPGLRVVSRTLASRYRGADVDAMEIARALNVTHVLHGSVRQVASGMSVSAQLINGADNSETWSENFSRATDELFEVQDSITRAVVFALHLGPTIVASGSATSSANRGTTNRQAYDLYLRGKLALERRGAGVMQAVERFEQAIALDSNFARAHAALAVALELLPVFSSATAVSVHDRVIASARRALALDSVQAEAYTALAMAHRDINDWASSLAAHRTSVALDTTDAHARVQYGRTLYHLRRYAASSAEFERARTLDPYSPVASAWTGHLLFVLGRNEEAIVELHRALEIDSLNPPALFMMAQALIKARKRDSARVVTERLVKILPAWRPAAGVIYALLGDRQKAEATIREIHRAPWVVAGRNTTIAMISLALHDTARALAALERATDEREPWFSWGAIGDRHFDPILGTARFSALLRRVGFDEQRWASSNAEGRR